MMDESQELGDFEDNRACLEIAAWYLRSGDIKSGLPKLRELNAYLARCKDPKSTALLGDRVRELLRQHGGPDVADNGRASLERDVRASSPGAGAQDLPAKDAATANPRIERLAEENKRLRRILADARRDLDVLHQASVYFMTHANR